MTTQLVNDNFGQAERDFLDACIKSGMRETRCERCGCYLLTRGDKDICPPCEQQREGPQGPAK